MERITEKLKAEIDYEKQSFENMKANPYEIAVAASKYAREINDRVRKHFGSEIDVKPRNLAMKKLEDGNIEFTYDKEEKEEKEISSDEAI